jgi:hypothetical protein
MRELGTSQLQVADVRLLLRGCFSVFLAIMAATFPCWAQQAQSPSKQGALPIDQIKKTVVFIHGSYYENGVAKDWDGTGFFISQKDPLLGDRLVDWLVTNKHMIREPAPPGRLGPFFKQVQVRANTLETAPEAGHFVEIRLPVVDGAGNVLWCLDPDESVDLALLRVGPNEKVMDVLGCPTDLIATKDVFKKLNISENDEVLFAGLFAPYRGLRRNFPIVRHGKLALVTDERIPIDPRNPNLTEELILAEVTSFGGNSGSPVFLRVGGVREGAAVSIAGYSYYLLGVMQGFFSEGAEFALEITPFIRGTVMQNSGIAAVIPAEQILHILLTPRARAKTLLAIANTYLDDGKYTDAERLFNESISMSEKAVGDDHPDVADGLEAYAVLLRNRNRIPEANRADAHARRIRAKGSAGLGQ